MAHKHALQVSARDSARLADIAQRRLSQSPYYYLKNLRCRIDGDVLSISGCVPYVQLRQLAERIVSRVDGVGRIINAIEVINPVQSSYRGSSGA